MNTEITYLDKQSRNVDVERNNQSTKDEGKVKTKESSMIDPENPC